MSYEQLQTCRAVITVISVLTFQQLSAQEQEAERNHIADLISHMDKLGIPWRLQNQLFYVGEHYDVRAWYLAQLVHIALERSGYVN